MASNLPEDVVFQILLGLPVISLLRFKTVCKSWYSLIQNSAFIHQHLDYHHHHPTFKDEDNLIVMLIKCSDFDVECEFRLLSGNNYQEDLSLDSPASFIHDIVSSCDGIICLCHRGLGYISLWNPATKQARVLPKPPTPEYKRYRPKDISFVHDIKTDDYKVIKFVSGGMTQVEIYNLSSDTWRNIDLNFPFARVISNPKVSYHNKIYCWLVSAIDESSENFQTIISLDINKEVFGTISLPDHFSRGSRYSGVLEFAILWGEISCIHWTGNPLYNAKRGTTINIWSLAEYGVKESWRNLQTIELEYWASPICYLNNGFLVINEYCPTGEINWKASLFDPVTNETVHLPFRQPKHAFVHAVPYKKSLVSVERVDLISAANPPPYLVN